MIISSEFLLPSVTQTKITNTKVATQTVLVTQVICTASTTTQVATSTSTITSSHRCYIETAGLIFTLLIMIISLLVNVIMAMILRKKRFKFKARYE